MFLPDNVSQFPTTSFLYSIPYLALGGGVLWAIFKWKYNIGLVKSNRTIYNAIFFIFLLFFGLRWHIMSDTIVYYKWYRTMNLTWSDIEDLSVIIEPGFLTLLMLVKTLGLDFSVFVFFNSLIDFFLLYAIVKNYSINIPLTLLLFLAFNGIAFEINLMRNIKAILIFAYSLKYIQQRKFIKFLICQTIGFTFHYSAILFVPMYWICNIRFNMLLLYAVAVMSILVSLLSPNILESTLQSIISQSADDMEKLTRYATEAEGGKINFGTIERLLTLFLVLFVYKKEKSPLFLIFANLFLVFFVSYSFLGFNSIFRDRVPYLFIFSYWFLYPYILMLFNKRIHIFKSFLIALCFLKIMQATNYCGAYYENIMFKTTTIEQRDYLNDKIGSRD